MKKRLTIFALLSALIMIFSIQSAFAEPFDIDEVNLSQMDSLTVSKNAPAFRLFPTSNMWTFIKLDTRTGQLWQVQWSLEDNQFETVLSLRNLSPEEEVVNGRFTLHSTTNTYNFILLDQIDGRVWQVQWSHEVENRFVWRIY
jgi:hypothetical protein